MCLKSFHLTCAGGVFRPTLVFFCSSPSFSIVRNPPASIFGCSLLLNLRFLLFHFPTARYRFSLINSVITLFLFSSSLAHLLNLLFLLLLGSIYIISREKFFCTLTFSAIGQSHKKIFTKCLHICPLKSEKQEKSEIPPS